MNLNAPCHHVTNHERRPAWRKGPSANEEASKPGEWAGFTRPSLPCGDHCNSIITSSSGRGNENFPRNCRRLPRHVGAIMYGLIRRVIEMAFTRKFLRTAMLPKTPIKIEKRRSRTLNIVSLNHPDRFWETRMPNVWRVLFYGRVYKWKTNRTHWDRGYWWT